MADKNQSAPHTFQLLPPKDWQCEYVHTFFDQPSKVRAVTISHDDNLFVSGCGDNTIKVWSLINGDKLFELQGHTQIIRAVTLNTTQKILASGSNDGKIKLWDLKTGLNTSTLTGHSKAVTALNISTDGKLLISGSDDKTVRLWNLLKGEEIKTLYRHKSYVQSVAFNRNSSLVASSGRDNLINIRNLYDNSIEVEIKGHLDTVSSVQFTPDGKFLISSSHDRTIKVWDLKTGQEIKSICSEAKINHIFISFDGKVIASTENDGKVRLYDLSSGARLHDLSMNSENATSVAFDNSGQVMIVGDSKNGVNVWYIENRKPEIPELSSKEKIWARIWATSCVFNLFFLPFLTIFYLGFLKGLIVWLFIFFAFSIIVPSPRNTNQVVFHEKVPDFIRSRLIANRIAKTRSRQEIKPQTLSAGKAQRINTEPKDEKPARYSERNHVTELLGGMAFNILVSFFSESKNGTHVKSYRRKDGTRVKGHYRKK